MAAFANKNKPSSSSYRAQSTSTALAALSAASLSGIPQRNASKGGPSFSGLEGYFAIHKGSGHPQDGYGYDPQGEISVVSNGSNSIVYTEEDCEADIQILIARGYSRELAVKMHKQQVLEMRELTRCGSEPSLQNVDR